MFINEKNKLRTVCKSARNGIDKAQKTSLDMRIFTRLVNSEMYKNAELILTYVSFGSEADTINLIEHALSNQKRVAVPFCSSNEMFFYEINGLNDLTEGKFGIPTVNTGNNSIVNSFENALCILPGLSFDFQGGRLGYGGGFYDRFLANNSVPTVALTYERCVCSHIPQEEFDIKADIIVTENYILKTL